MSVAVAGAFSLVMFIALAPFAVSLARDGSDFEQAACPPADNPSSIESSGKKDYRQRNSSERLRWEYTDNWSNHMSKAMADLQTGRYPTRILSELSWTFARWPNHQPAFDALIRYAAGGGRNDTLRPLHCFFQYAREFAPDDVAVPIAESVFYWKTGDMDRARAALEVALAIDPNSAEAHYNLGLLLFDAGDYAKSEQHARAAYSIGYPLPGLKNKLRAKGYFKAPLAPPADFQPKDNQTR